MSTASQQRRLFAVCNLMKVLGDFVSAEHRAAADLVSLELANCLDSLFDEWRAGIALTASLPTPDQLLADAGLQAEQLDAEALIAQFLTGAPVTTRDADAVTVH